MLLVPSMHISQFSKTRQSFFLAPTSFPHTALKRNHSEDQQAESTTFRPQALSAVDESTASRRITPNDKTNEYPGPSCEPHRYTPACQARYNKKEPGTRPRSSLPLSLGHSPPGWCDSSQRGDNGTTKRYGYPRSYGGLSSGLSGTIPDMIEGVQCTRQQRCSRGSEIIRKCARRLYRRTILRGNR